MFDLSPELRRLQEQAIALVTEVIGPAAEQVDAAAQWPAEGMAALARERLTALTAPARAGGHEQGLLGLTVVTQALARGCASTAMCFGMHCVATAVIAAKSTAAQARRYLEPIARGEHLTTLALSEGGSGAHFFIPQTALEQADAGYLVRGEKQFVTNGSHADSYVVSTQASDGGESGDFSCLVLDRDQAGMTWGEPWRGFGMRGNDSRSLRLDDVRVPAAQLLGEQGDQVWYVFEVVAPFFLTAMAGTYVGVAQAALDATMAHVRSRQYAHSGQSLADVEVVQHRLGQLWTAVEKSRLLVDHAARLGDSGSVESLTPLLAAKADAANTAVLVTNEAMTLCGGIAYRENSVLARLLRDARASHVMSPTTEILTTWTGRSALGMTLL